MKVPDGVKKMYWADVEGMHTIVRLHTRCPIVKTFIATGMNDCFKMGQVRVHLEEEIELGTPAFDIIAEAEKGYQTVRFYHLQKYSATFTCQ